ncbi:MAG TPA: lysylphosphatidylglycerol synthase transmembrane domain-containing protein, partial [Bdellovibrionales bacterium]|nr:lysylphosphatidylglycerol synthase transmembrane domain-containing protein [Bdellovibrionales bacterium]
LVLMRGLGFRSSVRETMPLTLIGLFFNFVMPGGVGGDVVKGYYLLQDHRDRKLAAVVSIFMDRIMGFFMMVATAFFALFLSWDKVNTIPQLKSIALGVTVFFLAFLFFFALSLSRRVGRADFFFNRVPGGEKIKKVYEALHTYRGSKRSLLVAATLSLLGQLLIVLLVYVVGQALGVDQVPLSMYFFLVPVGSVVQALPLSPAGIGVGQAAFYFLFNLYLGFESPIGPTAVTLMQVLSFGWGLFGAFFYLRRKKPNAVPIA